MINSEHENHKIQTINQILKFLNQHSVSKMSFNNLSSTIGIHPKKLNCWLKNWFEYDINSFNFSSKDFILNDRTDKHELTPRKLKLSNCQYTSFKIKNPTINIGWTNSPFGKCFILEHDTSIVGLAFGEIHGLTETENNMLARLSGCNFINNQKSIDLLSEKIFYSEEPLNLNLVGTKFQIKAWSNLLKLKTARVTTYSDLAKKMNIGSSVRALATAIGKNPIAWLLPCHRIIRKDGGLGGYRWGLPIKNTMLLYEYIKNDPTTYQKTFGKVK